MTNRKNPELSRRVFTLGAVAGTAMLPAKGFAQAAETVNVGYSGPLSGGAALYGKNCLDGLEMAAKEINAAGGFEVGGKKFRVNIVALDDKYAPSLTAVNAKRLRAQDKAPIVFTPHSGGNFALQAFNEAEGFIIGAYTSVPNTNDRGNKMTIRIPPKFTGYIPTFVDQMMSKFGKKVAMVPADHDYAKAWSALFHEGWTKAGGQVVSVNPMSYNKDTDFYSGVSRALAANPDVLFIGGASEPSALIVRQARELGFKGGFAIMDQAKMDEMSRVLDGFKALEGSIGVMPLVYDTRPGAEEFVKKFREIYKRDPGTEMSYHYSSIHALVEAMKRAGTTTEAMAIMGKMSEAYASLKPAQNPSRISSLDAQGGSNIQVVVAYIEGGKVVPVPLKTN